MRKTAANANSVFLASVMVVLACITYMALTGGPSNRLSPAIIILGTILYLFLILKAKKLTDRISCRKNIVPFVIAGVYLILLFAASMLLTAMPFQALADIRYEALKLLEKGRYSGSDHFAEYRHEIPMVFVHAFIYGAGRLTAMNYLHAGNIAASLSIAATSLGLYFTVKHFRNASDALWVMLAFVTNPVFFLYASYTDSNILSMPWVLFGNLLILKAFSADISKGKSRLLLAAGAAVSTVSFIMLPENLIPVIVVVIYLLFSKTDRKKMFAYILIPVSLVLILTMTDIALALGYKTDRDANFPPEHYIVIGINQYTRGWYSNYPIRLTRSFPTYSDKKSGDRDKIKESFEYMGLSDFMNHTASKWKMTWGQGVVKEDDLSAAARPGTLYDYTLGTRSVLFDYVLQAIRSGYVILMLIAVTGDFIKQEKKKNLFLMIFAAAVVFQMFWETRSIVTLKYLPWMLMLLPDASEHIKSAGEYIRSKLSPEGESYGSVFVRSLAVGLTIINILVFATVRNGAVRDIDAYEDMVVFQPGLYSPKLSRMENSRFVQTFTAKREFNVISFNANLDIESDKIFSLAVRNSAGNVVVRKYFGQHNFNRYESVVFKLDNMIKAGDYELIIKPIDYNRRIRKNPVTVSSLDYSPDRTFKVNNRILNTDLNMTITRRKYRTMLPRKVFYGFTGLVILTEAACAASFFVRKKKDQ